VPEENGTEVVGDEEIPSFVGSILVAIVESWTVVLLVKCKKEVCERLINLYNSSTALC
jgi:hypothetical protein